MSVEVRFRGPMLVVTRKTYVDRILIPNGKKHSPDDKHPDNDLAKRHYAGIFVLAADEAVPVFQMSLFGKRVTITDNGDFGGRATREATIDNMVPLHRLVQEPANPEVNVVPDGDPAVTTVVTFEGGTASSDEDSQIDFNLDPALNPSLPPGTMKIPLYMLWKPKASASTVTIRISDVADPANETNLSLSGTQKAYFYNYDSQKPDKPGLDNNPPCTPGLNGKGDIDFKWIYQLLDHDLGEWTLVLSAKGVTKLPCPIAYCPGSASPSPPLDQQATTPRHFELLRWRVVRLAAEPVLIR